LTTSGGLISKLPEKVVPDGPTRRVVCLKGRFN